MDRYALRNAVDKVEGYYDPAPHEVALGKQQDAFMRAKAECLVHLRRQIEQIESLTFDEFRGSPLRR